MRLRYILLAALMLGAPPSRGVNAMAADDVRESVHREIAALVEAENKAWNMGDANAFAARALPDIVFTNIVGMFSVGKAPFLAQHQRIFATIYKGSTSRQDIQHITLVKPDVAIVDTLAVVAGAHHAPPGITTINGEIHARLEQVLVRHDDGWWVAAFHNVAVSPAALADAQPPRP